MATPKRLTSCCRWFMKNCAGSPRIGWHMRWQENSPANRAGSRSLAAVGRGTKHPQFKNRGTFFCRGGRSDAKNSHRPGAAPAAVRHGGGQQRVELDQIELPFLADDDQLLAVNEALDKLAAVATARSRTSQTALLRRTNLRRSGGSTWYFCANSKILLGACPRLALPRNQRSSS